MFLVRVQKDSKQYCDATKANSINWSGLHPYNVVWYLFGDKHQNFMILRLTVNKIFYSASTESYDIVQIISQSFQNHKFSEFNLELGRLTRNIHHKYKFSRSQAVWGLFSALIWLYLASEEVSSETLASPEKENIVKVNTNMSKINHR